VRGPHILSAVGDESVYRTEAAADSPNESSARTVGYLALAWSSVVTLFGLAVAVLVPLAIQADQNNGYCESIDHPGPCSSVAPAAIPGLVVVAIGLWGVVASVGLLEGRSWARRAVLVTFSVWAVLAFAALVDAAVSPDGPSVGVFLPMLLLLGLFVTIVVQAARSPGRSRL
jgi:hypothetical protein